MSDDQARRTNAALNVLAKWRGLFAGWQLGTRPKGDPESDAVRSNVRRKRWRPATNAASPASSPTTTGCRSTLPRSPGG
jgi:hypothetical protein